MTDSKLRDEVKWFAEAMEKKLKENDYKGGWKQCSPEHLMGSLDGEFYELKKSISAIAGCIFHHGEVREPFVDAIIEECADLANFAMMIADNAKKLKSSTRK